MRILSPRNVILCQWRVHQTSDAISFEFSIKLIFKIFFNLYKYKKITFDSEVCIQMMNVKVQNKTNATSNAIAKAKDIMDDVNDTSKFWISKTADIKINWADSIINLI